MSFRKRSWVLRIAALFVVSIMLFAYQNCSQPFSTREINSASSLDPAAIAGPEVINQPPSLAILSAPDLITRLNTATVLFRATAQGTASISMIKCSLDDGPPVDCMQGYNGSSLSEGRHRLKIIATDNLGLSSSEVFAEWTVDTVVPAVSLVMAPPAVVATTVLNITFSAIDNGSGINTVVCSVNNGPVNCPNGSLTLSNLTEGVKSLRITATDRAQNVFVLNQNFEVRFGVPSITLTANPLSFDRAAVSTFSYTGRINAQALTNFECSRDGTLYLACNNGTISYNNLAEGNQSFYVRSIDISTGARSAPQQYNWVIDRTSPVVAFSANPAAMSTSASASFTFAITELNPNIRVCNLDNVEQATCNSPVSFINLTNGNHSFRVTATDRAGNIGSVTFSWAVNTIVSKTLAWDASLDANNVMDTTVTGYKVYTATVPGMYGAPINVAAGSAPSSVLSLERGRTYYFAVSAVNATGSESDKSTVLTYLVL